MNFHAYLSLLSLAEMGISVKGTTIPYALVSADSDEDNAFICDEANDIASRTNDHEDQIKSAIGSDKTYYPRHDPTIVYKKTLEDIGRDEKDINTVIAKMLRDMDIRQVHMTCLHSQKNLKPGASTSPAQDEERCDRQLKKQEKGLNKSGNEEMEIRNCSASQLGVISGMKTEETTSVFTPFSHVHDYVQSKINTISFINLDISSLILLVSGWLQPILCTLIGFSLNQLECENIRSSLYAAIITINHGLILLLLSNILSKL